ncbi:MAG: translation initiation factor IF-2 [Bdellovibrionales bacterium]|nr:translation initiation factor IF-2 [Bdellovibrionales bacterium]
MSQPKVYEFAKELGMETLALMDKIKAWKLPVKSHMSSLTDEQIDEIKNRLEEESGGKKKKKAKKKVVKKKATKKKKVAKKATTTVVKRSTKASSGKTETTSGSTTKKTTTTKKKVIRRKAGGEDADETQASKARIVKKATTQDPSQIIDLKDDATKKEELEQAAAEAQALESQQDGAQTQTEAQTTETATEKDKAPSSRKGKIVGKIDLSKVSGPSQGGGAGRPAGNLRSQPRNLRAGYIAAPDPMAPYQDDDKDRAPKKDDKPKKKTPGAKTEQEAPPAFAAADFRKREVIFQPKKKRLNVGRGEVKKTQITTPKAHKRVVKMYETITVDELAKQMNLKAPQLIKSLIKNGVMANMNTALDYDTVSLIVPDFGFEAESLYKSESDVVDSVAFGELDAEKQSRPPVITVMGHVDHGKTTLLDSIRKANVVSGEAGGITQHIGAYQVMTESGHDLTFLDTPGHEAFTLMRARGANVTDVAIIVVAADDGVMPQTIEAINHAKASGVPIIVAVNKMDKQGANPDRVKQQLMEHQVVPEEWGGDTVFCPVSAISGDGINDLLEQVYLNAEILELKANPKRSGTGVVIESRVEKGRGSVATLLVQDGSIKVGQVVAAGKTMGKIRSMFNDKGESVKEIGPGKPVEITGLSDTPLASDRFDICKDEKAAEDLIEKRKEQERQSSAGAPAKSIEEIFAIVTNSDRKELPVVLKADVAGSVEAIKGSFDKVNTDEVKIKVIHSAVGGISESDVLLASTSQGVVFGFNVRPDSAAEKLSKEKGVQIKCYSIIYDLLDDVKKLMSGLLSPDEAENTLGRAEVRDIFTVPKAGTIAGSFVTDGKVVRNSKVRVIRDGRVIYDGVMNSLKRFKDDAKEVATGFECGIGVENFNDIKVGDILEAYEIQQVAREL